MTDMDDAITDELFETASDRVTSKQILDVLRAWHNLDPYRWAFFPEFIPAVGVAPGNGTRMDAWAIDCYPSNGHMTVAYEIKVSRSDFLREIRDPSKRIYAMKWSQQFYFVAPVGLISKSELPLECGLKEVGVLPRMGPDLQLKHTVKAPVRAALSPTWHLVAAVARRSCRVEKVDTAAPPAV